MGGNLHSRPDQHNKLAFLAMVMGTDQGFTQLTVIVVMNCLLVVDRADVSDR
jgi:hypothetical protein